MSDKTFSNFLKVFRKVAEHFKHSATSALPLVASWYLCTLLVWVLSAKSTNVLQIAVGFAWQVWLRQKDVHICPYLVNIPCFGVGVREVIVLYSFLPFSSNKKTKKFDPHTE